MGIANVELTAANKEMMPPDWSAEWKRAGAFFGVGCAVLVLLYWATIKQLVETWGTATFSHCFLILPISLYLVWTEKERAKALRPTPNYMALAFLPLFGAMWFA